MAAYVPIVIRYFGSENRYVCPPYVVCLHPGPAFCTKRSVLYAVYVSYDRRLLCTRQKAYTAVYHKINCTQKVIVYGTIRMAYETYYTMEYMATVVYTRLKAFIPGRVQL